MSNEYGFDIVSLKELIAWPRNRERRVRASSPKSWLRMLPVSPCLTRVARRVRGRNSFGGHS